jgi:hypothetical protein
VAAVAAFLLGCDQGTRSPEGLFVPEVATASDVAATSVKEPFSGIAIVCNSGEIVDLAGTLHVRVRVAPDGNGGFHASFHFQPMGVGGVGRTTGTKFRGTGVTRSTQNVSGSGYPIVATEVNNFRIIGQGPGNNQLVHAVTHTTINANGELTADVDLFSDDCR